MKEKVSIGEGLYKKTSINDLILFVIYILSDDSKKCDFEDIVNKCFSLFSKVFSFAKYPKWPDARKLDRPLRALRNEGFISGNPRDSFLLTKKGRKRALEVAKFFKQGKLL